MDWSFEFREHPNEELLESYALHRLSETEDAIISEHLLGCEQCREIVTVEDDFSELMRATLSDVVTTSSPPKQPPQHAAPLRYAVGLGISAIIVIGMVAVEWRTRVRIPTAALTVELSALRSDPGETIVRAPAQRALKLKFTAPQTLPSTPTYRLAIVDAVGNNVFSSDTTITGGNLSFQTSPLPAGKYWVRVFVDNKLVREVGLFLE